jgi:hypothetical protein
MLRRWVQFGAVYLALTSQVLLPLAQRIHETTADGCGGACAICNPGAANSTTAAAIPTNFPPAAAGSELLFDVTGKSAPVQTPTQPLRAMLQLAIDRARQNGRQAPRPTHDPANCLICLQIAQCRSADRPTMPAALPSPLPAMAQAPVVVVASCQLAVAPLPPARAPPISL